MQLNQLTKSINIHQDDSMFLSPRNNSLALKERTDHNSKLSIMQLAMID